MDRKPKQINRIAIKSTPEQIWGALTDPAATSKFWYNGAIHAEWKAGAPYVIRNPAGEIQARGELLVVDPPRKLSMTWQLLSFQETADEKPSHITWEIAPHHEYAGVTLVTVIHDEFEQSPKTADVLEAGVPVVLSGLKTLLETGKRLTEE